MATGYGTDKLARVKLVAGEAALSGDNTTPTVLQTGLRRVRGVKLTQKGSSTPADSTRVLSYLVPYAEAPLVASHGYTNTDNGAHAAQIAAVPYDRRLVVVVTVDENFADGGGTQTQLKFGWTSDDDAVFGYTYLADKTTAFTATINVVLPANKALFATAVQAGAPGTGGATFAVTAYTFNKRPGDVSVFGFKNTAGDDPTLADSDGTDVFSYMVSGE